MNLSFKGIKESENSFPAYTEPGIAVFTITGVELTNSAKKQTPGLTVTFANEQGQFTDAFYLTDGALPRLVHLMKGTGLNDAQIETITSSEAAIIALTGKKVRLAVGGDETLNKDNNPVIYARLGFASFAEQVSVNPSKLVMPKIKKLTPNVGSGTTVTSENAPAAMPWETPQA